MNTLKPPGFFYKNDILLSREALCRNTDLIGQITVKTAQQFGLYKTEGDHETRIVCS
jgi:hypothetical protein